MWVCVCVTYIDGELVYVCWTGGQCYMYGHILWTMKKMPFVSQHDGVNSQGEVTAHKQKHMVQRRIIKSFVSAAPESHRGFSINKAWVWVCETANLYVIIQTRGISREQGDLPVGNETNCVLHAYILKWVMLIVLTYWDVLQLLALTFLLDILTFKICDAANRSLSLNSYVEYFCGVWFRFSCFWISLRINFHMSVCAL